MAENQATIIPAQPDYELLVCWFLPDGKINVTRTPILAWRVEPSGKATPVTIDVRHGEGLTAIRAPGGRITDAAGESSMTRPRGYHTPKRSNVKFTDVPFKWPTIKEHTRLA